MTNEEKPLVELDANGEPAVLNYNVPEPTSYSGRNLIQLEYDASIFHELIGEDTLPETTDASDDVQFANIADWVAASAVLNGSTSSAFATGTAEPTGANGGSDASDTDLDLPKDGGTEPPITRARRTAKALVARVSRAAAQVTTASASTSGSVVLNTVSAKHKSALTTLNKQTVMANVDAGKYPYLIKTATGSTKLVYAEVGDRPNPGIYLVESYRLSNFLGDYGAGRTVGTFSLLPGEKTTISIKTWKSSTTTDTTTSSIFDSYTTTAEDDYESTVQSENSDTESKDETTEWNVEAEASGNWGVAKASVSGGASESTNSSREEFAKNVSSATEKHAQAASAQRDVTVNTTTTSTTETGEETAIEREIQNINVSRTLNFVFRQLNQEHISLLHLLDVRIGFFNGYVDTKMEVPLHEIDRLLEYCVKVQADRDTIKADVLYALANVYDYQNTAQNLLVTRAFAERDGTTTSVQVIDRTKRSTYDPDGRDISVEGVILTTRSVVLRTDAVIVEALIGEANALDDYSIGLQEQRVREQQLTNDATELLLDERRARLEIVSNKDAAAAEVWAKVFAEGLVEESESASSTGTS